MSSARLRLVECRALLGGEYDPMRAVWDEKATLKERRLLLAMAGRVSTEAGRLINRPWCELTGETRAAVVGALRRWREWSDSLA